MTTPPPVDLEGLENLLVEATPRPWAISWSVFGDTPSPRYKRLNGAPDDKGWCVITADLLLDRDASLIVALVNAAPALLAEVRAARERRLVLERLVIVSNEQTKQAERERDAALDEVARLRGALDRYGEHEGECPRYRIVGEPGDDEPCTCGYDAARRRA